MEASAHSCRVRGQGITLLAVIAEENGRLPGRRPQCPLVPVLIRDEQEYQAKWQEEREVNRIPEDEPMVFLEVSVADASEFEADLEIRGEERFGYQVLTVSSAAVPNSIAAICLAMRDEFGLIPHVYFDWTEGSPLIHFLRFILWGSGEVAPVTREILRRAEPDRSRRPHVHAG